MGFFRALSSTGLLLLLVLHLLRVSHSSEPEVATVDVHQATKLLDSGSLYLDVRTVEEYKKGHVAAKKILNVPYWLFTPEGRIKNPKFLEEVSYLCKETDDLVVACKSGVRSFHAASELIAAGFKKVRSMEGGYDHWVDNGFPVKKEQQPNEDL